MLSFLPGWILIFITIPLFFGITIVLGGSIFLFGLVKIVILILRNQSKKLDKYKVVETSESIFPFSLFKWIIINPEKYSSEDVKQIIAHEKMHAFQLHSVDLIIIEVLVILFWFNPFIYWYRKSIREIHEYLADQAVVENGFDQIDYQKLLLNQVAGSRFIGLTSRFSNSLSKNRLKMLTMMKSKNITKFKIAIVIPIIVGAIFFFACHEQSRNSIDEVVVTSARNSSDNNNSKETKEELVFDDKTEELVYFD